MKFTLNLSLPWKSFPRRNLRVFLNGLVSVKWVDLLESTIQGSEFRFGCYISRSRLAAGSYEFRSDHLSYFERSSKILTLSLFALSYRTLNTEVQFLGRSIFSFSRQKLPRTKYWDFTSKNKKEKAIRFCRKWSEIKSEIFIVQTLCVRNIFPKGKSGFFCDQSSCRIQR